MSNLRLLNSFFVFHACAKAKIWAFFCKSISIFLSYSLFFLCLSCLLGVLLPTLSSLFCMEFWLANFLGKVQINLQRVVCKQQNWQWIFPQNVTFFSECNSDRIGQNIQNEVWLERSIFEVVVVYQFIPCEQRPFDLPR